MLGNALVYAASWGRVEVATYLLNQGAQVNLIPEGFDYSGTPLHSPHFKVTAKWLTVAAPGANPSVRDTKIDKLAEDWADHGGHSDLAQYIRRGPPTYRMTSWCNKTPFMLRQPGQRSRSDYKPELVKAF